MFIELKVIIYFFQAVNDKNMERKKGKIKKHHIKMKFFYTNIKLTTSKPKMIVPKMITYHHHSLTYK